MVLLFSDKLLMHILVLILHLNDGKIDLRLFSEVRSYNCDGEFH